MNSKVAFRARTLDANRALSVLREHELPPEFLENGAPSAPRITQQEITTGMEKEEETEHHLQQALNAQQLYKTAEQTAIPIPEINEVDEDTHRTVYRRPFRLPKSLINSQAFLFESEDAAYDADEEDTAWLAKLEKETGQQLGVAAYERMIQRLEEGSSAQRLVTLAEARLLVKEEADETLAEAVYQQWRAKRDHTDSLVPTVLTEKRDGSNSNNPYVAFRRRKEKMQTRKNRKNDELSYERMLKMTLDLRKASLLLELIKRREEAKRELCSLVGSMFERRYAAGDFSGSVLRDAEHAVARQRALDERQAGALPMSVMGVVDFIKFSAIARSPSTCAALQSYVDRTAAECGDRGPPTRKRRFDNPRSAVTEESLPGTRRRAWHTRGDSSAWPSADARNFRHAEASLLTDDDEPLDGQRTSTDLPSDRRDEAGRKRRRGLSRFGPKPETPTQQLPTTQQAPPPADRLPPAERSTLLLSHLPATSVWRLEDSQATAAIDRDFAFRRKPGCRYAAPATPAPQPVARRYAADQCQCVRRAASSKPPGAQRCFSLVCMHTGRHTWRLCYARRRVSRARRVVLDLAPASDNVSLPVGASAARFDHAPVENGLGGVHLSPSKPVGVALSTLVGDAERAMCGFCDPVTLQCSAGSLCGASQPHAVHLETLRQLQEARAPVFVPRSVLSEPAAHAHVYHALPNQAVQEEESPSSQLLDLVSLYVGRQQKDPRCDQSHGEPDRTADTQRIMPASDATDSADRRAGDTIPLKRMSLAVVDSGGDLNRLAAANGCVLSAGSRVHNGVTPAVGTSVSAGAGRERCEPLPLVNGNNNNDATQAASSAPTRLVAIGKRITDSLSGLLNGIAAIPMGANENGKPSAPTLAGSQSQAASTTRGSNSPTTNPTRLLLAGASGANSKQSSTLSSQSSAVSSDADADALISEQVRTPTIST